MPTPTIPNRTVSLGGTRPACSDVGARDAPTAAPLSSRNSRRDQVVFLGVFLSLPRGSRRRRPQRWGPKPGAGVVREKWSADTRGGGGRLGRGGPRFPPR